MSLSLYFCSVGVGKREEVVIRCEELADIFLDCDVSGAIISNLTLEDDNSATAEGLVAVRAGGIISIYLGPFIWVL